MIEKKVLENGLKILYKKTNTKSIALVVTVKAGCIYEPDEIMGVSHFLEHMIFNGTKTRTQIEISKAIEDLGGEFNAATGRDSTLFYIKILKKHFDLALDIMNDMIMNSTFPIKSFEIEKGVVLEEINMAYDTPGSYQFMLFQDSLFKDHPASKRVLGTKDTITNLTRAQLFDYYKQFYVPNNMIITITGDVKDVVSKISNKFESLKSQKLNLPNIPTQVNAQRSLIEKRNISQSYFVMGYALPCENREDSFALDILRAILGRGQSGWIFDEIRNKRGLAYEAGVYLDLSIDTGFMCVYANSHKKNIEKIKKIIFEQFDRLQKLTEEDLNNAKNYIEGEFILELENNVRLAEEIAHSELCQLDLEKYIRNIKKVNLIKVKEVAKCFNENYSQSIIEQK